MKKDVVLDSFALVCLFQKEPGYETVRKLLHGSQNGDNRVFLNAINWGEFYYVTRRRFGAEKAVAALELTEQIAIEIVPAETPRRRVRRGYGSDE